MQYIAPRHGKKAGDTWGGVTPKRRRRRERWRHGQQYGRPASVRQGQYGCGDEIVRRPFQERAGDRGGDGGLLEKGVRAGHGSRREADRREVAGEGDRGPERLRQELVREFRGRGDQARRALCRPRQGDLQAVREPVRQGWRGEITPARLERKYEARLLVAGLCLIWRML